jgi:hypothetical protein
VSNSQLLKVCKKRSEMKSKVKSEMKSIVKSNVKSEMKCKVKSNFLYTIRDNESNKKLEIKFELPGFMLSLVVLY